MNNVKSIINDFCPVDRFDAFNTADLTMSQIERVPAIMKTINRLAEGSEESEEIKALTSVVAEMIGFAHNDLALFRERLEKAGIQAS